MFRKPVPVTKNSILKAVQTQRRSNEPIIWVILGLTREGVPPTALILDEKLITERGWYEEHEYAVIERVVSYQRLLDVYRLTNQSEVVDTLYTQAIRWQKYKRAEQEAHKREPIRQLLTTLGVTEYTEHYRENLRIGINSKDYTEGGFQVKDLFEAIEWYEPYSTTLVDGEIVHEDKVLLVYKVTHYNREKDEYEFFNLFRIESDVTNTGLDYKTMKFMWLLPDQELGVHASSYRTDPLYVYLQALKEG